MTTNKTFDVLLLIARPAAGKSEIIDHLKKTPIDRRISDYHIGNFDELDDFPMLWTWFEEDDILTKLGHPRLHTDTSYDFLFNYLWDVLIKRISLEYRKTIRDFPNYHADRTMIVEFARGTEHGGFARAFNHLSPEIVAKMAILYINVSWVESFRKNQQRFNPNRPDSILEHGLTDEKMRHLYRHVDWQSLTADDPYVINIQGINVPYTVFENNDDVTTQRGAALTSRLADALGRLWILYQDHRLTR
jgi:hypothetical protein